MFVPNLPVKPKKTGKTKRGTKRKQGQQNQPIDFTNTPMREILRTRGGKPTQAALEREEKKKRERLARKKRKKTNVIAPQTDPIAAPIVKLPPPEPKKPAYTGPQVQVIDGKLVLNTSSLFVESKETDISKLEVVEDDDRHITSATYSNRTRSEKWTATETNEFYERTRRQIRNKYKKEEKDNEERVEDALRNPLKMDVEKFRRLAGLSKPATKGGPPPPVQAPSISDIGLDEEETPISPPKRDVNGKDEVFESSDEE